MIPKLNHHGEHHKVVAFGSAYHSVSLLLLAIALYGTFTASPLASHVAQIYKKNPLFSLRSACFPRGHMYAVS